MVYLKDNRDMIIFEHKMIHYFFLDETFNEYCWFGWIVLSSLNLTLAPHCDVRPTLFWAQYELQNTRTS